MKEMNALIKASKFHLEKVSWFQLPNLSKITILNSVVLNKTYHRAVGIW